MFKSWKARLAILILAGFYIVGLGVAFQMLPSSIAKQLVSSETLEAAGRWQVRVLNLLDDSDQAFENSNLSTENQLSLQHFVLSSDAFRIRLFNGAGEGIWTSGNETIENISQTAFFGETVAHGKPVQLFTTQKAKDIEGFQLDHIGETYSEQQDRLISEIYMPVIHNGEVHGVVEMFLDVTDRIEDMRLRVLGAGALVAATFTFVLCAAFLSTFIYRRRVSALNAEQRNKEKQILERDLQRNREVRLLSQLSEWMQASKSMDELFDIATNILSKLIPESAGSIYIYSNSRDVLEGATSWNGASFNREILPDDCWGLRRGRLYTYGLDEINFSCGHDHFGDDHVYFCIPIIAHGDTIGLLHIDLGIPKDDVTDIEEAAKLAQTCAEQLSLAIANVRLRDELRSQSIRDPLTGLFNRRHFFDVCRNQITGAKRKSESFAIASFDIDHFKTFNDNHGHDAGDMVLRAVGEHLMHEFEGNDFAFRIGGEEFTILLDTVGGDAAYERIEALRRSVEAITVEYSGQKLPRITISAGISVYPQDGNLPQTLMKAADEALYSSKANGRNRVSMAGQVKDDALFNDEELQSIVEDALKDSA